MGGAIWSRLVDQLVYRFDEPGNLFGAISCV